MATTTVLATHPPPKETKSDSEDDIFALPLDEIVRRALGVLSKRTRLIAWGSLLDQHLGLPRGQKNFTFLVPDEELEGLSATLTGMHLPIATLPNWVVGDLLRLGRLHRVSRYTDPLRIQSIHLMPASLPGYTEDELEPIPLDKTEVILYIPRPSAVYAGILRMMRKYRLFCPERYRLQSDLELLVNYNLLGLDRGYVADEDCEALGMDQRIQHAVERIRGWGKAGEWRPGEESVEDLLVGVVKGDVFIGDLPSLDHPAGKTPREGDTRSRS
ncbi:hypothetical protein L226DRAFT_617047 [Lentinus tigrinus ALCF2SS1-7]|uniref:Uncharacterized protein n=1 Tax=Lentinus tigrinus ALCF2SS1-6 TaxID=1328759 RepID=A0A5C2RWF5_9APHY|nr:hypothetical protein L227DRAFT_656697 [Lentinus tigrinus ALCF2SS1-6]RPD69062.1 hypothetical protein L226DRAFT_617047 [Lentinus tigrinus ALCF2SS1-7]